METHMLIASIAKGRKLGRFLTDGLVEVHNIREEHDALANEMKRRGYNHNSPLPDFKSWTAGNISIENNIQELIRRCPDCRARIEDQGFKS